MTERNADQPVPGPAESFDIDANDATLPLLQAVQSRYGDVCRVRAATRGRDSLVLGNPDDIRWVLLSNRQNYIKGVGLERIRVLLGNGLIVSEGDFWARQRRMMQPAFHRRVIRGFAQLIRDWNLALCARWQAQAESGTPVNLTRDMSEVTLQIVLRAIFGADLEQLIAREGRNPFELVTADSQRDLAFAARFRALTRYVRQIVDARRAAARVEADFLSLMMEARDREGAPMSDRALIDEVMSLIVAGHETTASTLNWTWYLLAQHPEVEARVQAAADAAPADAEVGVEQVGAAPYLSWVVQETMRLYPPVWLFGRRNIAADRLGGYAVAPGTDIFISPYLLHRDPRHWPDPERFDPDRFAPAAEEQRHRFAYLPFSAGPRHCIGEGFAMAEMAIHLILLARRFRLEYVGPAAPECEFQINLRTRQDLYMRVHVRRHPETR